MGLRFRKSITICPGVRLNLGTSGASISTGVPGFRKSFHTNGRVTTTMSIPGTGISYVNSSKKTSSNSRNTATQTRSTTTPFRMPIPPAPTQAPYESYENPIPITQLNVETLKSVHKSCDDAVDWTEILVNPVPPDTDFPSELWRFYHNIAEDILNGNIDTYLQLIYEVNPLDDLLAYGGEFQFGTDQASKIEVEFVVNESALSEAKTQLTTEDFNDLLQDYICSTAIRIARDMFALLPIQNTLVHAVYQDTLVLSVDYSRSILNKVKLQFSDPSDVTEKFMHNMNFSKFSGFEPIQVIWTSSSK